MPHLILVKHARPDIMPTVPARQWPLSEAGRAQCALLADQLAPYAPAALVSSAEPKALETAHLVARSMHASVHIVEGLHEHDRSSTPWLGPEAFARAVVAFFHHPAKLVMGSETAHQASQRFGRAMATVLRLHAEQNIIVFTHGTVLSLFVAHATGLEPLILWQRLGLPSFVVLTLPQLALVKIVEQMTLSPPADAPATDAQ